MPAESPSLSAAQTSLTADPERFNDTAWDLLIASHALSEGCVLVSADQAFAHVDELTLEAW